MAADTRSAEQTVDDWCAQRRVYFLAALVLVAVLLRVVYFWQLNAGPLVDQHRWEQSDMNFFDRWASEIAGGDWLTDQALHPVHRWHQLVADAHFRAHPQEKVELARQAAAEGDGTSPTGLLWNRWFGEKRFHQEPLYPYLVAMTYRLLGQDVRWVFAWQMVLGVLNVLLVYWLARSFFGEAVGLVAGGLIVLCGPVMYYEMILLRTTLITFAGLVLVCVTDQAIKRERWTWWLALGIACGLALLLKTTFAVFLLSLAVVLLVRFATRPGRLVQVALCGLAGLAIGLAPLVARNVAVGVSPLAFSSVGAVGFVLSNGKGSAFGDDIGATLEQTAEIFGNTDGQTLPVVAATLATHDQGWSYAGMVLRKFVSVWHWYEVPNNANFYFYQEYAGVLRWMPVTFSLVAPLGLVGLLLSARHTRCWPLWLLVMTALAPLLVHRTTSRYRVLLLVALVPLAALTLVQVVQWVRVQRTRPLIAALVAFGILWLLIRQPLWSQSTVRPADYMAVYAYHYGPRVDEAAQRGAWEEAAEVIADALRYEPRRVRKLGPDRGARTPVEAALGAFFAQVHQKHALVLDKAGRPGDAAIEMQRADALLQATQGGR